MQSNTCSNPVRCKPMSPLVNNPDAQMFQGMKAALEEPNGVLGTESHHRQVVVEFFIAWKIPIRFLVRCDDPIMNLSAVSLVEGQCSSLTHTGYIESAQIHLPSSSNSLWS